MNNHTEPDGYTDHDFIATAFYAYSTSILAASAKELEKLKMKNSIQNYIKRSKMYLLMNMLQMREGRNQFTNILCACIEFNLLPENLRAKSAQFLVETLRAENHLSTGFLGTPYLCHVLSRNGYTDVAYDFCFRKHILRGLSCENGCDNYLGALGWSEDRQYISGSRDEFLQSLCLWCIGDWMYRVSAGIETMGPGYKHIIIHLILQKD